MFLSTRFDFRRIAKIKNQRPSTYENFTKIDGLFTGDTQKWFKCHKKTYELHHIQKKEHHLIACIFSEKY
jgi:hypothetical protein